jgi:hypothetical protein
MFNRRSLLFTAALGAVGLDSIASAGDSGGGSSQAPPGARIPGVKFIYECDATLTEAETFGTTTEGVRRIIPITGGTFHGPEIRGQVLGGSYDWNLTRSDGGHSVEAAYFLKTDDGVLIRVVNRGVGGATPDVPGANERFFMFTTPVFEAPVGKYDWMNRTTFVATLGARHGSKNAVLIRVFNVV